MVLGATCVMLFLCFRNTFSAYLIWGWSGLIALSMYVYGFMMNVQYVQIFAIVTLVLFVMKLDSEQIDFKPNRTSTLMIIFGFHAIASAALAASGLDRNWELCTNLLKTLLFCLLMPMLVTSRLRIHAMVVMLALAISFHGGLDGLKFLASGGSHYAHGNAKLGDNNHFAMIIVLSIPLLLYLYFYSARRFIRWGFIATLVITTLAVVATTSRGGFATMVLVAIWVVMKGNRKVSGFLLMGLTAVLITQLAPASWSEKINTINQASEDASFMGRVAAWKRASAIAVDNPVFGGGFHAGQAASLFPQYRYKQGLLGFVTTPDVGYPAASHSIYFEVLGDLGFVGLFIFLSLILNAFVTGFEINNLVKTRGEDFFWIKDLSDMLMASVLVFVAGGSLLSAAYFDFPYIIIMLMEVLKLHALRLLELQKQTLIKVK